jgi:hypothetical protein
VDGEKRLTKWPFMILNNQNNKSWRPLAFILKSSIKGVIRGHIQRLNHLKNKTGGVK